MDWKLMSRTGPVFGSFLAVVSLMLLPQVVVAQICRVLDPELQGQYSGECMDGLANGKGEATGIARYRGEFRAGMKQGSGIKDWPWGDSYQGHFSNDQMDGQGRFIWGLAGSRAGEQYLGSFVANLREGAGEYRWSTGESLTTEWQADLPVGPVDRHLVDRLIAGMRADAEAQNAVGRTGVKVCRTVKMGISEREWIAGVVVAVGRQSVEIAIDSPGPSPKMLAGVDLRKGAVLWDAVRDWKPCI